LLGGDGGFARTVGDLWDHADLEEVRRECQAQIERAIYWGFDITHLDSHLGALSMRPEFFDVALDLAVTFQLPMRLGADSTSPFRRLTGEEGVLVPDHVLAFGRNATPEMLEQHALELSPGVTEMCFRPASDTPELRALTPEWSSQVAQRSLLLASTVADAISNAGATLIGYAELREVQRSLAQV